MCDSASARNEPQEGQVDCFLMEVPKLKNDDSTFFFVKIKIKIVMITIPLNNYREIQKIFHLTACNALKIKSQHNKIFSKLIKQKILKYMIEPKKN